MMSSDGIPTVGSNVGDGEETARSPPDPGDAFPQSQLQASGEIMCSFFFFFFIFYRMTISNLFAVEAGDEQKSDLLPASKGFLQESSQSDQASVPLQSTRLGLDSQGVVATMCPVLPPATAIKKFDRQNGGLIV